ncbi:hypothetical protein JKP88DRAFT_186372 [Tribonema minus]|uniref:Uncharacterized protein n=1 Tax=Tribonema minus TaxID=303371 RepID=A0A836CEG7_9STRA|nr:hypothetical protein JKP88DRAFT_186372 [Tribonema minus]
MMHYDVPLHPFQATVAVDPHSISPLTGHGVDELGALSTGGMALYMCTPQSFPPTPVSRACVMSRSTQFSDDVLFLARDHLRLDEQCRSRHSDETSRLTAEFLRSQARLAVLNGHAAADGISLTCGHHCAAKTGTAQLYSSVRAMVPVLRNRYVFCQFSVAAQEAIVPSLSIGLSTPEMPLNTLVGTWSHSIGLSSSGQILLSSRWYSCVPGRGTFGVGSTIGVLVFLDGSKVIPSWDGEMVTAYITYSVDGQPVRTTQRPQALLAAAQAAASAAAAAEPYAMALPLPRDRDLFPTLTLHSPLTQVFCRFCAADMVHATRAQIGAPPGVVVYALDGSVVLDRDQA